MALTTHLHLALRLKKEWRYTCTPPLGVRGLLQGELYLYEFLITPMATFADMPKACLGPMCGHEESCLMFCSINNIKVILLYTVHIFSKFMVWYYFSVIT